MARKNEFGYKLSKLIQSSGMTGREVAYSLGVTEVWISKLSNGRGKPSLSFVARTAALFGVKPVDLIDSKLRKILEM